MNHSVKINIRLDDLPNGMEPSVWGPYYWDVIHTAVNWIRDTKQPALNDLPAIKWFINSLPHIIPCYECASHTEDFIQPNRHRLMVDKTREFPAVFINELHNHANTILNKSLVPYQRKKITTGDISRWKQSLYFFVATQASIIWECSERIITFLDIMEGLLPFLAPSVKIAEKLNNFSERHRHHLKQILDQAVKGDTKQFLQYLNDFRQTLLDS